MKVALVYDRVNKWGGAERVLLALHSLFPDAPLYTSVYEKSAATWAQDFTVIPSFLQKFSIAHKNNEIFAPLMPLAFETINFDAYDTVISVTSEYAKGIITPPHVKHICICLTPTRYLWSGYNEYFSNSLMRVLLSPLVTYLRSWDIMASSRPDVFIAISETVQDRVQTYYTRDSDVIYPPIENDIKINPDLDKKLKDESYFLFVSRLSRFVPYKKVELVLKTAQELNLPLTVIGDGRDREHFQKMAGPSVTFMGKLTDEDLFTYYKNAQALIFPAIEDFGLVMAEAQSMGTPVVAFRGGAATEIIREGKTGVFFEHQTVQSLKSVLQDFDRKRYNTKHCIENAQRFSFTNFEKQIKKLL